MADIPILQKKPVAQIKIEAKAVARDMELIGRKAQVILVVDVSGSMANLFRQGIVTGLVERALGLAMNFDDDGKMPVYGLDNGVHSLLPEVDKYNLDGYVNRYLQPLVGGGTNYAPVLRRITEDFGAGDPGFVIFCTDGENFDRDQATQALQAMSYVPIFVQALGIGNESFRFLRAMDEMGGRLIDNAGFSQVILERVTDEQLYRLMLAEFAGIDPQSGKRVGQSFHEKAQAAGMLNQQFKWTGGKAPAPAGSQSPQQRRGGLFGGLFG